MTLAPKPLNLNCQACGTRKGLDALNSLRMALTTEITDLSSAYLVGNNPNWLP